jgi:hypothetical protein
MASSTPKTIALEGCAVRKELLANAVIYPGELLEITSGKVDQHSGNAGVLAGKLFALESPTAAAGTSTAIDTTYPSGDSVYYAECQPGDVVYGWGKAGETFVTGVTQCVSDGAGAVKAATVDANTLENSVVGIAAESKVVGGGARERLKIRIV